MNMLKKLRHSGIVPYTLEEVKRHIYSVSSVHRETLILNNITSGTPNNASKICC